jgi:hypothetical protein
MPGAALLQYCDGYENAVAKHQKNRGNRSAAASEICKSDSDHGKRGNPQPNGTSAWTYPRLFCLGFSHIAVV